MNKKLLFLSFFISNIIYAQSSPQDCKEIISDSERLACYDSFFAKVKPNVIVEDDAKSEVKIKKDKQTLSLDERAKLEKDKQNNKSDEVTFGLSYKQLKKEKLIPEKEERIFTYVSEVTKNKLTRKILFRLENGHIWESESSLSPGKERQFREGAPIELELSRMGGFWMINRSSNIRIKVIRKS